MSERGRLEDSLLEALVDGDEVDWEAAAARANAPAERRSFADLRLLHDRLLRSRASAAKSLSESLPSIEPRRFARWRIGVLVLAFVQAGLGVAGYLFGSGRAGFPSGLIAMNTAALGAVALWLLAVGRGDPRTLHLAGLFVTAAAATAQRTVGSLSSTGLQALVPDAFLAAFAWGFAREFPRVQRLSRFDGLLRRGERVAVSVAALLFTANLAAHLLSPASPANAAWLGALSRPHQSRLYWILTLGLALLALVLSGVRVHESDAAERRRFRLFVAAIALGFSPLFLLVLAEAAFPSLSALTDDPGVRSRVATVLYAIHLTIPFTTTYSVVALRVFEVRVLIRRAVRYALARSTLNAVTCGSVLGLLAYLYLHRERRIDTLLQESPALVVLPIVSLLLLALNDRLMTLLDRAFFREPVAWRDALAATTSNIRHALTAKDLEDSLSEHLDRALRARHVLLFFRRREGELFTPVGAGRPLPVDSPLGKLLVEADGPLITASGDPRSVLSWLSMGDRQWVVEQEIGMLMPVTAPGGEVSGLIGLGPKREDTSFSEDDASFVSAVASSVSLVMENQGLRSRNAVVDGGSLAVECRGCGEVRSSRHPPCRCGGEWQDARLPWLLNDKFRLETVLGRGGMGVVYRALDVHLRRRVALKTLPRVSPPAATRLRKEARSMAALEHPSLAGIHGLETWYGIPVLVVEYLARGTLADREPGPWEGRAALRLGVEIAGALIAMHDKGLAHRDVKPSNIGFTMDRTPKLLDFGLARLAAEATLITPAVDEGNGELPLQTHSRLAGTLLYLPPEALRGRGSGRHHDLWALALVVYELIAGRHPFREETSARKLRAGELPAIPRLTELAPAVPPGLARFLESALDPVPERRPATASDLRAGMLAVLDAA